MRSSYIGGLILVIAGILLLLDNLNFSFSYWEFIRGIGILLIGLLFFSRGLSRPGKSGLFLGAFLSFLGIYLLLQWLNIFSTDSGLTVIAVTFALGLSFYMLFFIKRRDWGYLLTGNVFLLLGILFLMYYLKYIPSRLFIQLVDVYWPLLIILAGLAVVIHAIGRKRQIN
ncbi:MAG: hypothetical protein WAN36_04295 [Calditrichia bacterium]